MKFIFAIQEAYEFCVPFILADEHHAKCICKEIEVEWN